MFTLDTRLQADTVFIADGPLSQVRLLDDSRYPWLVLVPRVADVSEWIDLDGSQQRLLLAEINQVSKLLRGEAGVQKINIGALGNVVRQLHIHVVGRNESDPAWPGPVWGHSPMQRHAASVLSERVQTLAAALS